VIDCAVPDDLRVYSLQGLPPEPLPPVIPPDFKYSNSQITNNYCPGNAVSFTGSLPSWLTVDGENLIVAAGAFKGISQAKADSSAQSALDNFIATNVANGSLTCATPYDCGGNPTTLGGLVWTITPSHTPPLYGDAASASGDTMSFAFNAQVSGNLPSAFFDFSSFLCNPTNSDITVRFTLNRATYSAPSVASSNNYVSARSDFKATNCFLFLANDTGIVQPIQTCDVLVPANSVTELTASVGAGGDAGMSGTIVLSIV
jgi:hypothetical protein